MVALNFPGGGHAAAATNLNLSFVTHIHTKVNLLLQEGTRKRLAASLIPLSKEGREAVMNQGEQNTKSCMFRFRALLGVGDGQVVRCCESKKG